LVKVVKNKMAPPFARAEFDLLYNEGISQSGEILDLAIKEGVVEKSGAWFSFESEKLGQGRDAARLAIKEQAELRNKIKRSLKKAQAEKKAASPPPKTLSSSLKKH